MKKNKSYLLIAAVLAFLFTLTPTKILAQENIIDRLDKSLGVKLPAEYDAKVREFVMNNKILKDVGTADYTAQFIEKQMKVDWKIDKQNQLVFLWHCIYKQITHEDLFNPEDGDSNRLQDFNDRVVGMRIRAEGQRYKNEIIAYMNQRKAEADRQIAEADRQIAEAKQRSAKSREEAKEYMIDTFDEIIKCYKLALISSPNDYDKKLKESFQTIVDGTIKVSKHFNFDCKAIIRKKIGDETKYKEFLKIFEIE